MAELFKIKDISFLEEDFQDDINEYEDIIPIIKDLEQELTYEKITCTDLNDCCEKTKENYFVEIQGFINSEDEFITKEEVEKFNTQIKKEELDLFVIRVYKCVDCNKWIIDILE